MRIDDNAEVLAMMNRALGSLEAKIREAYNKGYQDGVKMKVADVCTADVCIDDRFEIIAKAKQDLIESTNIETDKSEMAVIDNILFRCWQMGWLDRYEENDDAN